MICQHSDKEDQTTTGAPGAEAASLSVLLVVVELLHANV